LRPTSGAETRQGERRGERRSGKRCQSCAHFRNDAGYLEAAFKGPASLGFGSARADDGLCLRHERYLDARSWCADSTRSGEAAVSPRAPPR